MSSEGDKAKNLSSETDEKPVKKPEDSSPTKDEEKDAKADAKKNDEVKKEDKEKDDKVNDKASEDKEKSKENSQNDKNDAPEEKAKVELEEKGEKKKDKNEKEKKGAKKEDTEGEGSDDKDDEGSDEEEDDDEDGKNDKKKDVPLLDQPLEKSGPRDRKKTQRFDEDYPTESKELTKTDIPDGSGTQLGEIPRIDASISRFKNDDLKLLHKLLFNTPGKTTMIKKNIKKFNGFDFKKDSEEYNRKVAAMQKFEVKQLKIICEMLDLEKKGNKEEIAERVIEFLIEPKDSGKPSGGGRPKRTAAVRANNRGYSSHDDSYSSDERHTPRARRDKGKRSNLKDESSSESDEEFHPSDASDEKPPVKGRRGRKKAQSDDEASDLNESASLSEDSDDEPKNKKKKANKVANNKPRGRGAGTPRRGRKPGSAVKKPTPTPKRGRKRKESSEEEESDHKEDDGSSSEDEPLAKKAKPAQPPTDDEIKTYVKEILDGANLEEITMKTVCKQVYAHYPDFDLAHKKDFIKSTVKSLIST